MIRTIEQVMATVSCNGMRNWEDERVEQAIREYAAQFYSAEQIRQAGESGEINFHDVEYLITILEKTK